MFVHDLGGDGLGDEPAEGRIVLQHAICLSDACPGSDVMGNDGVGLG
jgi:hypothetical protein